jgi:uncharacterized membrane protein YphA (DoxX/SURF4 family)
VPYLVIVVRCLIGTVFLVSLAGKVAGCSAFSAFAQSIRRWRVLPPALIPPAAVLVVTAELAVCLLIAAGSARAGAAGLILAALLLTAFAAAIGNALRRGVNAPCRCFGPSTTALSWWHVARNVVLVAAALAGVSAGPGGGARPGGTALAGVTGLLLAVVVIKLDDVIELFRTTATPPTGDVRGNRPGAGRTPSVDSPR